MLESLCLESGCTPLCNSLSAQEWDENLKHFTDASLYQSSTYGRVFWGESNSNHFALKQGAEIVAMAQVRLVKIPNLPLGFAYVQWGPVWRRAGKDLDEEIARCTLRALKEEYAVRRGLILRVCPKVFQDEKEAGTVRAAFLSEGYSAYPVTRTYRTLVVDLEPSLEQLRKSLRKDWRKNLVRAEGNGLEVQVGSGDDLFGILIDVYEQMWARKQFARSVDVEKLRRVQQQLPEHQKMRLLVCWNKGVPVSAAVFSPVGDTGVCLLAGTNTLGRETCASYLVKWQTITHLKSEGFKLMDLGGTDPVGNTSVDHFKRGISGRETMLMEEFAIHNSALKYLIAVTLDRKRLNMKRRKRERESGKRKPQESSGKIVYSTNGNENNENRPGVEGIPS